MDVLTGFFYLFSAILLISAFQVITARNPVHAVLFLMLAFSQAAGLWLLLQAEFLAIILVLVYLGAVMVLFLFVVMMLDIHIERIRQGFWHNFPLAMAIGVIIAVEMSIVIWGGFDVTTAPAMADAAAPAAMNGAQYSNTKALGLLLYSDYLYGVEVAVTILLVAMIAAIALTYRERHDNKALEPGLQVRVQPRDRIEIIKMPSVPPAPAPVAAEAKTPEAAS